MSAAEYNKSTMLHYVECHKFRFMQDSISDIWDVSYRRLLWFSPWCSVNTQTGTSNSVSSLPIPFSLQVRKWGHVMCWLCHHLCLYTGVLFTAFPQTVAMGLLFFFFLTLTTDASKLVLEAGFYVQVLLFDYEVVILDNSHSNLLPFVISKVVLS